MKKSIAAIALIALVSLPGCATLQSWFPGVTPASALQALANAMNSACGAVPTVKTLEGILAAQGISNPTETEITAIASQVCSVLKPPATMSSRAMGAPGAPVVLGYYHGAPVYGHWAK